MLRVLFLSAAVLASAPLAAAPDATQRTAQRDDPNLKKYCTGDYLKFCGNLAPENPEVDRCFERNMKALSVNCRGAIDFYQQSHKQGRRG